MNEQWSSDRECFAGSQVSWTKKIDEKSRFGELSTEEIQKLMDKAVHETTKKAAKFGMKLFNGTYTLSFP